MTLDKLYQELQQNVDAGKLEVDKTLGNGLYRDLIVAFAVEKITITDCVILRTAAGVTVEGKVTELDGACKIKQEYQAQMVLSMAQAEGEEISYYAVMSLVCNILIEELVGETAPFVSWNGEERDSLFMGVCVLNPVLEYRAKSYEILLKGFASTEQLPERWEAYRYLLDSCMSVEGKLSAGSIYYPHLTMTFLGQKTISLPIGKGSGALVIDTIDDFRDIDKPVTTRAYMLWEIEVTGLKKISFQMGLFSDREEQQFSTYLAPPLSVGDVTTVLARVLQLPEGMMLMPQGAFLSSFGLQQLDLVCGTTGENRLDGLEMKHIRGIFTLDKPLEIFVPQLKLESFQAAWESSWWGGEDAVVTLFMAASASVSIGNLLIEGSVTGYVPYMEFEGTLSLQNQESFQTVAEESGVKLPDFWKSDVQGNDIKNEIARIDTTVDAISRSIDLHLAVEDVLKLKINDALSFELEEVNADISYGAGEMAFGVSGMIALQYQENADGESERFGFSLSAEYSAEDWIFTGELAYGQVDIVKLVKCFLGMSVEDQQALHIVLQDFSISYSTKQKELILYASCEVWFTILGIKTALGGKVRFRMTEETKEAALAAYLEIGIFTLLAQVDDIYKNDKKYLFRMELWDKYLQAVYQKDAEGDEILNFSLGGMTVGDIVLALIHLINPNAKQTLSAPWNVLNQIALSDFVFVFNVTKKTAYFLYHVNRSIAGVMELEDIGISYDGKNIQYILTGSCLGQQYTLDDPFSWDAQNGSPQENIAANEQKVHLHYFAVGNHLDIEITGNKLKEILESIRTAMEPESGIPDFSYREEAGWLVALDFELSDILQVSFLLYDPKIYGAVIEVNVSEKSPLAFLNGLLIELYYKKISDATGMFHCRFTLPKKYSQLDFGAVKLYLGEILLEIYTNGSFYLDLGFPHNRDFSSSWGLTLGIFGGKGGVYLGAFHGDAVNSVPAVTNGAFSPVIKIGIGLSVGLSQSFDIGIAKGGVSLMAVGMFEGIFALFHPVEKTEPEAYYYKVSAVVGVVGTLFLSVDFKIITISANAQISAFCNLEMESYRKTQLTVDLDLKVSASIKIVFIKISFAFHFEYTASFTFGSDQDTPWRLQNVDSNMLKEALPRVSLDMAVLSDRISISPVIVPLCSLRDQEEEQNGAYCMAFPVFLQPEDFKAVLTLLLKLLCTNSRNVVTSGYSAALQVQKISTEVDYEWVLELFSKYIEVNVSLSWGEDRAEDAEDIDGTVFPMLPQLTLKINDTEIDYGSRVVSEQYMQELSAYFEKLNADTAYTLPQGKDTNEEIPICGAILTDWVKMLVEELTGRVNRCFRSFTKKCVDLSEIKKTYGVEERILLADNPKMSLCISSLPELSVSICQGDSLQILAEKYSLDAASLWDCVAETAGLPGENIQIDLENYVFDNSTAKLTRNEAAAIFYVRFYKTEVLYSPYAEYILEHNQDVNMEWVSETAAETWINLPQGTSRKVLAGDSVVKIAKECAIVDGSCEEEAWTIFYKRFLEINPTEQADTYRLFGTYALAGYATMAELCRHCFPDFHGNPESYLLWSLNALRPVAVIRLKNIQIDEIDIAENLVKKYGADAIIQAMQEETANLSKEQQLVLSWANFIPASDLEEMVLTEKTVLEISAIISRAFLQGSRLSDPDLLVQKAMYEVLRQQIYLPDPLEDMTLRLSCNTEDSWVHVSDKEVQLTVDKIKSRLPEIKTEQVGTIQEITPFSEQTSCWTMVEGWKILNTESESYFGILPKSVFSYLEKYNEALRIGKDGKSVKDVKWAAMLTLCLYRKSKGVYYVLGVKGEEQDLVLSLITEKNYTCSMYYRPSRLESEQEGLILVDTTECTLTKTNLSKETHHPVNLLRTERQGYVADLKDQALFMTLLWECSVVGGGYWLYCPKDNISEAVFDEEGRGEIVLVASFSDFPAAGSSVNGIYLPVEPVGTTLYGDRELVKSPQLPAGCTGFIVEREFDPDDRFQSLFQMLGYEAAAQGKDTIYESAPIMPVETETGNMMYRFVFPMWKMYGDHPYAGVGKTSNLSLFLRDVMGNRRVYTDHSVTGTYNDLLIGFHELPNTKVTYGFVMEDNKRYVKIMCTATDLLADNGDGSRDLSATEADKARLQMAYWQYSCKDVTLSAEFSLCTEPLKFPDDALAKLTVYMEALYRSLSGEAVTVPEVNLLCEMGQETSTETICPITLYVKASRGDASRDDAATILAETKVMPMEDGNAESFEDEFESTFADYQIAYDLQNLPYAVSRSLFSTLKVTPFHISVGEKEVESPEFYALSPFAKTLVTKNVVIEGESGEKETYTFVNEDANQWEKQFLADIENFLTDEVVCRASIACPEEVNRLVQVKQKMAELLVWRLSPVRAAAAEQIPEEVAKIAKERFLKDLNLAYETGVIASYQAVWENDSLYRLDPQAEADACLSVSKLSTVSGEEGKSTFCMFFKETNISETELKVSFPYLEYNIRSGIEEYEQSDWLRLHTPVTEGIELKSELAFPFPKKECPMPPQLLEQSNGTEQEELMRYKWSCTLSAKVCNQDTMYLTLEYENISQMTAAQESQLDILAEYQLARENILSLLGEEEKIAEAYKEFLSYAERYISVNKRFHQNVRAVSERGGSINLELGFSISEKEVAVCLRNEEQVAAKMKELGASLILPEQVELMAEDGKIQLEVAVAGLSIYECNWMKPKAHMIRNENLFGDLNVTVNKEFVFYTETMELDRLHITADYKEIFEIQEPGLSNALQKVWEILGLVQYSVRLNMTIFYEYPVAGKENKLLAKIPVTFMTDISDPESVIKNVEAWKSAYMPYVSGGRLILDVFIYEKDSDSVLVHAVLALVNVW